MVGRFYELEKMDKKFQIKRQGGAAAITNALVNESNFKREIKHYHRLHLSELLPPLYEIYDETGKLWWVMKYERDVVTTVWRWWEDET